MARNRIALDGALKCFVMGVLLGLAALSPAPINEAPPPGYVPLPEHSEAQLKEEQRRQEVKQEVGDLDATPEKTVVPAQTPSQKASETLQAVQRQKSAEIVKEAGKNIGRDEAGSTPYLLGLLVVAAGFLGALGFRSWLVKRMPAPSRPKKTVGW